MQQNMMNSTMIQQNMMNPAMMQNMMNPAMMQQNMMMNFMNNGANHKPYFDPTRLDRRFKTSLMNETIRMTKLGPYRFCQKYRPQTNAFMPDFQPRPPQNICEVEVIHEHALDIAEQYTDKGFLNFNTSFVYPAVLNVIGCEFTGSSIETCENIRDDIINLRTTFNNCLGDGSAFPTQKDVCVYSKIVYVIRPKFVTPGSFIPLENIYRVSLITASPIPTPKNKLLKDKKMRAADLIDTCTIIECVFQTAIAKNHQILILTPFGKTDENNPTADIIMVYNYCIYKYGHLFKKIIIGIPPFFKEDFEEYNRDIIRPAKLITNIDKKYEKKQLHNALIHKAGNVQNDVPYSDNGATMGMITLPNGQVVSQQEFEACMNMMKMMSGAN